MQLKVRQRGSQEKCQVKERLWMKETSLSFIPRKDRMRMGREGVIQKGIPEDSMTG